MEKKKVYVLGNPVETADNAAVRLIPELKKKFPHLNFIRFDPTEEFPLNNKDLIIIDTVIGIKKVTKVEGLDNFSLSPRNSVHDYDLPLTLGILKKLGRIKKVTIIGIPSKVKLSEILKEVKKYLF